MEKNLEQKVDEIHKALIGDEYRKDGIVHIVNRHEKRINILERYVIGVTSVGAFIIFLFKMVSWLK